MSIGTYFTKNLGPFRFRRGSNSRINFTYLRRPEHKIVENREVPETTRDGLTLNSESDRNPEA